MKGQEEERKRKPLMRLPQEGFLLLVDRERDARGISHSAYPAKELFGVVIVGMKNCFIVAGVLENDEFSVALDVISGDNAA